MTARGQCLGYATHYDVKKQKWVFDGTGEEVIPDNSKPLTCAHCNKKQRMCYVNIPANLSHTGEARWAWKPIDICISTIIDALNEAKILTSACCCGHGQRDGSIMLQDGRELVVKRWRKYDE